MYSNDPRDSQINPSVSAPSQLPAAPNLSSQDLPTMPMQVSSQKPRRRIPVLAITVAVSVGILMVVGIVFVYIKSNNSKEPEQTQDEQTKVEAGRVSVDDIDNTHKSIDQSLNSTDDSGDFRSEDLLDDSLGL